MAEQGRHDLVLLDVMLPDVNGTEVCRRLRAQGLRTPVLFLTARDATEDKVSGLTVGGDDYVTKPFSLDELVARIHAVLRRVYPSGALHDRLAFTDLEMDDETHEVWRQGNLIELTATEFNLLRYLLENARRVLSKSEILDHVWNYDFDGDPNIVETYVSYLRKKVDCYRASVDPHHPRGGLQPPAPRANGSKRHRGPVRREGVAPVSLRRRLVVGMLVLLVVGLITTDVVTSSSLRSFLLGRLDEQIDQSQSQAYRYLGQVYARDLHAGDRAPKTDPEAWLGELASPSTGASAFVRPRPGTAPRLESAVLAARISSDTYVEIINDRHQVVFRDPSGLVDKPDPAPVLPQVLPMAHVPPSRLLGASRGPDLPESPSVDVRAAGSGVHYRVHAVAVPGGTLVTAISLDPTDKTLASLTHVEVLVSIIVIIALLLLALWIVRMGMRPLDDMTETAGAIASGDLTRRIRPTDKSSEVGRLGTALNGMLSQIEAAFAERTASESRLRRFVADASHELRTPLTSIRGYAELLRKGAFDSDEAAPPGGRAHRGRGGAHEPARGRPAAPGPPRPGPAPGRGPARPAPGGG